MHQHHARMSMIQSLKTDKRDPYGVKTPEEAVATLGACSCGKNTSTQKQDSQKAVKMSTLQCWRFCQWYFRESLKRFTLTNSPFF